MRQCSWRYMHMLPATLLKSTQHVPRQQHFNSAAVKRLLLHNRPQALLLYYCLLQAAAALDLVCAHLHQQRLLASLLRR